MHSTASLACDGRNEGTSVSDLRLSRLPRFRDLTTYLAKSTSVQVVSAGDGAFFQGWDGAGEGGEADYGGEGGGEVDHSCCGGDG
jgi:hypothetical protein